MSNERNLATFYVLKAHVVRPYMLDPFCSHIRQCHHDCCVIDMGVAPMQANSAHFPRHVWYSQNLNPLETWNEADNYHRQRKGVCECVHSRDYKNNFTSWDSDRIYRFDNVFRYTCGIIAKTEDHLFEFLAQKNQWSTEHQTFVRSLHPMARRICRFFQRCVHRPYIAPEWSSGLWNLDG